MVATSTLMVSLYPTVFFFVFSVFITFIGLSAIFINSGKGNDIFPYHQEQQRELVYYIYSDSVSRTIRNKVRSIVPCL